MKKRTVAALMTALTLSMSLSACGSTPVSSNNSDAARIAELEKELEELKSQSGDSEESKQQSEADGILQATIQSPETSGVCGANLTWYYRNGVLAITGTGEMTDYYSGDNRPWDDLKKEIGWVIIDDGVTTIGEYAFAHFSNLSKVVMPDTLTTINKMAFGGDMRGSCDNLKEITIPDSVTTIKEGAFDGCRLEKITLSNNLTTIERSAFSGVSCDEITVPDSVVNADAWFVSPCYEGSFNVIYKGQTYKATFRAENDQLKMLSIEDGVAVYID